MSHERTFASRAAEEREGAQATIQTTYRICEQDVLSDG